MIRAVVFDFGGVMTAATMPMRVKAVADAMGLDWGIFVEGFRKYRLDYDRGDKTLKEMYDAIFGDAGLAVAERERIEAADTASWLYRNEKTLEWMKALKARGFKIGILTNMAPAFAPLFRGHFADFIALADALVISGEEHLTKPDPAIYELLRARIGLPAEELCFIDDLEVNCEAARQCGWRAIRFLDNAQVVAEFEKALLE